MNINDPLGDLLTRIRNAQRRGRSTVSVAVLQASRPRARSAPAREATFAASLKSRRMAAANSTSSSSTTTALRSFPRSSAFPSRAAASISSAVRDILLVRNGLGISDPLHAGGRDVGQRGAHPERRRRNSLPGELIMSRVGKKPIPAVKGVDIKVASGVVTVKGPKGELKMAISDEVSVKVDNGEVQIAARNPDDRAARRRCGAPPAPASGLKTFRDRQYMRRRRV